MMRGGSLVGVSVVMGMMGGMLQGRLGSPVAKKGEPGSKKEARHQKEEARIQKLLYRRTPHEIAFFCWSDDIKTRLLLVTPGCHQ